MDTITSSATQEVAGFCTLCRSRCGTRNTVRDGRLVSVAAWPEHPTGRAMCAKGRAAPEIVHSARRLTTPLRRTNPKDAADPGWTPIGWDEALDEIARRFADLKARFGAESVAFGVTSPSGTSLSDSIDWIERFIRTFGSPNTAYATEICNWHKDHAHAFTFGCGMPNPDYANARCLILWGHNPANVWLAQAGALGEARKRGAKLIVIDPQRTSLARDADLWLRVRPGTDAALALGIAHLLLESGGIDEAFVSSWTNAPFLVRGDDGRFLRQGDAPMVFSASTQRALAYDTTQRAGGHDPADLALSGTLTVDGVACRPAFDLLREHCAAWTPARVAETTGVPEDQLHAAAAILAETRGAIGYHGWSGIGQHANATQTERAVAVLYALTGSFDAPGGNRVLNRQPVARVADYALVPAGQRAKALGLDRRPLGPPNQGWVTAHDLYTAILDGTPYPIRALMTFGANLLVSHAETALAQRALQAVGFHVHVDLFETPTARHADILLPTTSPWEREALRPGFEITPEAEEWIQLRPAMVRPVGQSRSDMQIVFDLAGRLGLGNHFFGGSLEAAWNHQLAPLGLTVEELRRNPEGLRRPLAQSYAKYADETADGVRGFATETRRVEIYSERLHRHGYPALPTHLDAMEADAAYPCLLTTSKNGYFCHSQHRGLASLRKKSPEPMAAMAPTLAEARGIRAGEPVIVRTRAGRARFTARIDPFLDDATVVADYGWWQDCPDLGRPGYDPMAAEGSNFNALIDAATIDPISGSVPHRSFPCDVVLAPDAGPRRWSGLRAFTVVAREAATADVLALDLEPADDAPVPGFAPGEHVVLEAHGIKRSYSLCGSPEEARAGCYRIAVKRVTDGKLSGLLHDRLAVGDTVGLEAPAGVFRLPTDGERGGAQPVVLVAAGVGITPFLGHLEYLAGRTDAPPVTLYYGSRSGTEHAFREQIAALARTIPSLRIVDVYSRPTDADRGAFAHKGRITADTIDSALIANRARFYLCGPPDMLRDLASGLVARGVPAFDIFQEVFRSPPDASAAVIDRPLQVRFARSGRALTWTGGDGTLLDWAEKNGLTMPSGCRVGQCESCAVPLVSGEVRYLGEVDTSEPGTCFTCQAVPASDLVLDA